MQTRRLTCVALVLLFATEEATTKLNRASAGIWLNHTWFHNYEARHLHPGHNIFGGVTPADVSVMTELISDQFSFLLLGSSATSFQHLPKGSDNSSINLVDSVNIPFIVAAHNRNHKLTKYKNPLQVYLSFNGNNHSKTEDTNSFEAAKQMAYEANKVYPGTVTTLVYIPEKVSTIGTLPLFRVSPFTNVDKHLSKEDLSRLIQIKSNWQVSQNAGKGSLKLGAIFDIDDCFYEEGAILKALLPNVDTLIPILTDWPSRYLEALRDDSLCGIPDQIQVLLECEENLEKVHKTPVKLLPLIVPLCEELPQRWEYYNEWVTSNNRTVIFFEAFDEYRVILHGGRFKQRAKGWWSIVPHYKRGSALTSQMFVDKSKGWHHWKYFADDKSRKTETNLTALLPSKTKLNYLSVHLTPLLYQNPTTYSDQGFERLVKLISSRFHTIVLESMSPHQIQFLLNRGHSHPATLISELNKNARNISGNSSSKMEVMLSFRYNFETKSGLTEALKVANKSNSIHPGTVTTLIFADLENYLQFSRSLQSINNSFDEHHGYVLATFMDSSNCEEDISSLKISTPKNPFGEYLPSVDMVAIELGLIQEPRPDQLLLRLHMELSMFSVCAKKLKERRPSLRVIPAMSVSSAGPALLEAWLWINEWGKANNESVIMFSAFDDLSDPENQLGWWRFRNEIKDGQRISFENLVEKSEENRQWLSGGGSETKGIFQVCMKPKWSLYNVIVIVLGGALVSIFCALIGLGYTPLRRRAHRLCPVVPVERRTITAAFKRLKT